MEQANPRQPRYQRQFMSLSEQIDALLEKQPWRKALTRKLPGFESYYVLLGYAGKTLPYWHWTHPRYVRHDICVFSVRCSTKGPKTVKPFRPKDRKGRPYGELRVYLYAGGGRRRSVALSDVARMAFGAGFEETLASIRLRRMLKEKLGELH